MSPTKEALMRVAPLRAARLAKDLSLRRLAQLVGTSRQAVANYENAVNIPTEAVWENLKEALDLAGDYQTYFGVADMAIRGRPAKWGGKRCAFAGCTRKVYCYGLCSGHYQQFRKGHNLAPIGSGRTSQARTCTFPGCTEPYRAKGLCNTHYHQRLRGEELQPIQARETYDKDAVCNVSECTEKPYARGLCARHYRSLLYKIKKAEKSSKNT